MQIARSKIGDDGAQLSFLAGLLGRRPRDHQIALKRFRLRKVHIGEITTTSAGDIQLLDTELASIGQGDIGIVGYTDEIIPTQFQACFSPIGVSKAAICQEGHGGNRRQDTDDLLKESGTRFDLDQPRARRRPSKQVARPDSNARVTCERIAVFRD